MFLFLYLSAIPVDPLASINDIFASLLLLLQLPVLLCNIDLRVKEKEWK
jgi:hypothetical protein